VVAAGRVSSQDLETNANTPGLRVGGVIVVSEPVTGLVSQ